MPRKAKLRAANSTVYPVNVPNDPNQPRPQEFYVPYFDEVQYRAERSMQWIRLDHDLLHAPSTIWFQELTDVQRYHFIGLLLLARQYGNRLPYNAAFLERKLSATEPLDLDYFLAKGLIVPIETAQPQSLQQQVPADSGNSRQDSAESVNSCQLPAESVNSRQNPAESVNSRQNPAASVGVRQLPADVVNLRQNPALHREDKDSTDKHTQHTHAHAPDGAAEGVVCGVDFTTSVHSWESCLAYAQHLHDSGQGIDTPPAFAAAIYDGKRVGQQDAAITAWLRTREQAAAQTVTQAAAADLEAARAAHLAQHQPDYFQAYLWPAVERFLLSEHPDLAVLQKQLQEWADFGPRADLACMKFVTAEEFFQQRPELGVLTFWAWDRQHNPQPFRW